MSAPNRLDAIAAALRGLFAAKVASAVVLLDDGADDLWPEERAAIAGAVPGRQAEFRAGRRAARRVLADLGLPAQALLMGPDRAPVWPEGVFGSIAHAEGLALAVATRHGPIGVDIEADLPIALDLWTTICSADELARMPAAGRGHSVRRAFAAKEALFKAQPPDRRAMFGFDVVEVTLAETGFDAHFGTNAGAYRAGQQVPGSLVAVEGVILAGVVR